MQLQFESLDIPLNKLMPWDGNVRSSGHDPKLPELVASIASHGILQNLVVKKATKAKYFVVAGGRRLNALSLLVEDGAIRPTYPVPCRLVPPDADATEISLAENQHKPMHPADEFLAFRALVEKGNAAADVAARFGVTERVVLRRLALARVSPKLIALYREDAMPLEYLEAFAITPDHMAQEAVWEQLQHGRPHARYIKQLLSRDDIPATDPRVRFVTIQSYEKEGGSVKRDLFSEGDHGVYITDIELLTRLCHENLQAIADDLVADGWKWVQFQPDSDPQFVAKHSRVQGQPIALSDEQKTRIHQLEQEEEALAAKLDDQSLDQDSGHQIEERLEALQEELQSLRQQRQYRFAKKTKAHTGVFVCLDSTGRAHQIYGLVRKEDQAAFQAPNATDSDDEEDRDASVDGQQQPQQTATTYTPDADQTDGEYIARYSAALVETLTTHKTAALAAELARKPEAALAVIVHALLVNVFAMDLHLYGCVTALDVSARRTNLAQADGSPAARVLEQQRVAWFSLLFQSEKPQSEEQLWQWCISRDNDTLLQALAFLTACTINSVETKTDRAHTPHANRLARFLKVDMTRWFTPTADQFFSRISKPQILAALHEAGKDKASISPSLKKADLAAVAERDITGTGWLPECLRIPASETETES